jgi:hypothetical protein
MKRGIILGVLSSPAGCRLLRRDFRPAGRGPQGPNVAEIEKVNDRLHI